MYNRNNMVKPHYQLFLLCYIPGLSSLPLTCGATIGPDSAIFLQAGLVSSVADALIITIDTINITSGCIINWQIMVEKSFI